jgi:hypothetical protein
MTRNILAIARILPTFIPLGLSAQVTLNQTDNFQDGTLNGWTSGANNPNPPTNVSSNRPGGTNDKYMRVTSTGVARAGGRLVVQNSIQWKGNYTAAGIKSISMHLKNEGSTTLEMRLVVLAPSGNGVSITPVTLPSGGRWSTAAFPITADALTGVNVSSTLTSVTEIRLLHSTTASTTGEPIAAQLGVDDITAAGSTLAAVVQDAGVLPVEFTLFQNCPNPFNPSTVIRHDIPKNAFVNVSVYDILGREVATLVKGNQMAGQYSVTFNATNLPSGVYFYSLHAGDQSFVQKMMLLK